MTPAAFQRAFRACTPRLLVLRILTRVRRFLASRTIKSHTVTHVDLQSSIQYVRIRTNFFLRILRILFSRYFFLFSSLKLGQTHTQSQEKKFAVYVQLSVRLNEIIPSQWRKVLGSFSERTPIFCPLIFAARFKYFERHRNSITFLSVRNWLLLPVRRLTMFFNLI